MTDFVASRDLRRATETSAKTEKPCNTIIFLRLCSIQNSRELTRHLERESPNNWGNKSTKAISYFGFKSSCITIFPYRSIYFNSLLAQRGYLQRR